MNYPIIKDKAGNTLAYLNKLINPEIREKVNGDYTFTFSAIIEDLKTDYILYGNQIEIDNNLFNIITYTKERTPDNKQLVSCYCEQVSYDLLEESMLFDHYNITATEALTNALVGTGFTVGTVENLGTATFQRDEQEINKRALLIDIAEAYNGELEFDKYTINLYSMRGANNGVQIRLGKNLKGIKYTVDGTKKDGQGNPKIYVEVDFIELDELETFKGLEKVKPGDTVRAIDEGLGIDVAARVLDYGFNPKRKKNSKVVLSNFLEDITTHNVSVQRTINEVEQLKDIWNRSKAINTNGTISTQILEGTINALQNEVLAGLGTVRVTENNGIMILDNADEAQATKALRLLGGVLAISNEKDQSDQWVWRTFGTGDGFVADEMITGILYANLVTIIGNKDIPNAFKWDANGLKVHKVNLDNTIDANQYIILDNQGLRFTKDAGLNWLINIGFDSDNVATKTYTDNAASAAETNAKSYTDTSITPVSSTANNALSTANTANTNAQNAQSTADTAQSTANDAKTKADNSVQQGTLYNSVSISPAKGVAATHGDGSETILDGDGFKRKITSNGNTYTYIALIHAGSGETSGSHSVVSPATIPSESELDALGVGIAWVTIDNPDFQNRTFEVVPSLKGFTSFSQIPPNDSTDLTIDSDVEVIEYDYVNARFKVRARTYANGNYFVYDNRHEWRGARFNYYAYATS